jgi:glycerol-3-phosphate O-acyltransferase
LSATVELPVWVVLVGGGLAGWVVVFRMLVPAAQWLVRSRANVALREVGARLRIKVRPFQRSSRRALVDRLVFDEKVQQAAQGFAREHGVPDETAFAIVRSYAREIVPAFNAYLYFRIGYWTGRMLSRSLYRVRIGFSDDEGLARIPENATVVFVMNHRSNMDYILAAYLAAEKAALSYAVGEWARVWPVQQVIRSMGAYFVRRNSRNSLYRKVLERYIVMATEAGVTQAVYPEGGLSRDGKMREPKFGVIDYMLRGFHPEGERDLVFVPLGLNYDRTLEDRTLLLSADPDAKPPGRLAAAANTLHFVANQLLLALRSRWYRFGYACVNFGTPVSVREYAAARGIDFRKLPKEARTEEVARLGRHLMRAVGALIPVLPVPLVATVLIEAAGDPLSELELKARVGDVVRRLEAAGARIYVPRRDWNYAIDAGLRMLTLRRLVEERDGLYAARPDEAVVIRYYANSIAHLIPPVLVATRDERAL